MAGNDPSGAAWAESFRRTIADAGLTPSDVGAVYGDARGTAAIDLAEARAISDVWRPGEVAVANIGGQVGHVHSTTALMSAVCASRTLATGWVPPIHGLDAPLPELAEHLAAAPDPAGRPDSGHGGELGRHVRLGAARRTAGRRLMGTRPGGRK